ncbi:His-Xaa-Ser system protein HxsD [Candidatus Woesearchaeota archaeon]|nr:His-Xaa-Ser system protein HxsD [Candidatus Woesearchaeota archaeon]
MGAGNLEINKKENKVFVSVNPKNYPLDVIYSASYVFLDKSYVFLDGNPKTKVVVELKPKKKYDLEKLAREFNNELLKYVDYKKRSEQTKQVREMIIQRALLTNDPSLVESEEELDLDEEFEDPEGIAIPWEEKYGKKTKNKR